MLWRLEEVPGSDSPPARKDNKLLRPEQPQAQRCHRRLRAVPYFQLAIDGLKMVLDSALSHAQPFGSRLNGVALSADSQSFQFTFGRWAVFLGGHLETSNGWQGLCSENASLRYITRGPLFCYSGPLPILHQSYTCVPMLVLLHDCD
jgi:hypothetical protein